MGGPIPNYGYGNRQMESNTYGAAIHFNLSRREAWRIFMQYQISH